MLVKFHKMISSSSPSMETLKLEGMRSMPPTSPSSSLFLLFLQIITHLLCLTPTSMAKSLSPSVFFKCNVSAILYPFGIPDFTPFLHGFEVRCDPNITDGGKTPLLRINGVDRPVIDINLTAGYVRVLMPPIKQSCSRGGIQNQTYTLLNLDNTPFVYSSTANKLTVLGCDALALLNSSHPGQDPQHSGCASYCYSSDDIVDGECSGVGCCQAAIPEGLKSFDLAFNSIRNLTGGFERSSCKSPKGSPYNISKTTINYMNLSNPCAMDHSCSRAYILAQDKFMFSKEDIKIASIAYEDDKKEVVLEWTISNMTCEEAKKDLGSFACKENSECYDFTTGYRCNCSQGYDGNPYLPGGCEDFNECKVLKPCVAKCQNRGGGFHCHCPPGTTGNGLKDGTFWYKGILTDGTGCKRIQPLEIGLSVGLVSLVLIVVGTSWTYFLLKKRKARKIRQTFFMRNGGLILQQQISSHQSTARIFSVEELDQATDGFNANQIIGQGGYGTVYKGTLIDQRVVAIKKSKLVDETQIDQFVNEVVILSQINHRHVVKLLGCCLESEVPMLVYEFISNGTLFHHLHEKPSTLSSRKRLQIAAESATALAYLHRAASVPIIHRDIKSANILLDEDYIAKVSDFGGSRLVPYNQTHVTTLVQGTFGYLDPEYFHTGKLTEKSDVYSFGVVLVELLTGEKQVSFKRSNEQKTLASYFVSMVNNNQILDIIDPDTIKEASLRYLYAICDLARRCLNVKGEERPTMKEVAIELHALRKIAMIQFDKQGDEEAALAPHKFHGTKEYTPESYLLS